MRVRCDKGHVCLVVGCPACRAESVQVVLDVPVAEQTDLIATLARAEILVRDVHVLHAERAT